MDFETKTRAECIAYLHQPYKYEYELVDGQVTFEPKDPAKSQTTTSVLRFGRDIEFWTKTWGDLPGAEIETDWLDGDRVLYTLKAESEYTNITLAYVRQWREEPLIVMMSNVMRAAERLADLHKDLCGDVNHDECQEDLALVADALGGVRAHYHAQQQRAVERDHGPGHCRHGVYVGGCGIDWMCGSCEMDDDC
jgi:hypothetical protein